MHNTSRMLLHLVGYVCFASEKNVSATFIVFDKDSWYRVCNLAATICAFDCCRSLIKFHSESVVSICFFMRSRLSTGLLFQLLHSMGRDVEHVTGGSEGWGRMECERDGKHGGWDVFYLDTSRLLNVFKQLCSKNYVGFQYFKQLNIFAWKVNCFSFRFYHLQPEDSSI